MATESVDEIINELLGLPTNGIFDQILNDDIRAKQVKAKAKLQAYYTRECARKVLEGRLDELEHYYEAGYKVAMQHASTFEELAAAYDDHLVDRIAELRAAIQETEGK